MGLQLPYIHGIPGGLQPNRIITITGVPKTTAKRFTVTFQADSSVGECLNIALKIDVQFDYEGVQKVVYLNSRLEGTSGTPIKVGKPFPFVPDGSFTMAITAGPNGFQITVDGKDYADFGYRLPFDSGKILKVDGDLVLNNVFYN